jgi:hypothetical protein
MFLPLVYEAPASVATVAVAAAACRELIAGKAVESDRSGLPSWPSAGDSQPAPVAEALVPGWT